MKRFRRHPFTLIEAIVATALLTSVLLVLYMSLFTVMHSWDSLATQSRLFDEAMSVDRTVDAVFSNAVPFSWPDDEGDQTPVFLGRPDEMTVAYMHQVNRLKDGAIRFCRFRIEDGSLVVYYCERPPFPEDTGSERLRRSILARDVVDLAFSYADLEDEEVVFVEDWGDRLHSPLAIRMDVEWSDGTRRTWLRRAAGVSYYERWGTWTQRERP